MRTPKPSIPRSVIYALYAIIGTLLADYISREAAFAISRLGVKFPTREFINAAIALVILLLFRKDKNPFQNISSFSVLKSLKTAILGIAPIFTIISIITIGYLFSGDKTNLNISNNPDTFMLLSGVVFMLLNAFAIQLLIQKFVLEEVNLQFGFPYGIISAAICFTIFQILQLNFEPLFIFNALCLGILIASIYSHLGLWGAVCAYGFWNYCDIILKNTLFSIDNTNKFSLFTLDFSLNAPLLGILSLVVSLIIYKLKKNKVGENKNII